MAQSIEAPCIVSRNFNQSKRDFRNEHSRIGRATVPICCGYPAENFHEAEEPNRTWFSRDRGRFGGVSLIFECALFW